MTTQTQTKPPATQNKYTLTRGLDAQDPPVDDEPEIETPPITVEEDDKE